MGNKDNGLFGESPTLADVAVELRKTIERIDVRDSFASSHMQGALLEVVGLADKVFAPESRFGLEAKIVMARVLTRVMARI